MPARIDRDALLAYWRTGAQALPLTPLECWLADSPRFAAFADQYRDKVRKKLRNTRDADGVRDVLCELETARCLLREPRFDVAYEAHAHTPGRAPDFTVTYRTHTRFHVEVARLRAAADAGDERLAELVAGKLGQTLAGAMNVLVVWAGAGGVERDGAERALKRLQARAERNDTVLFARYNFDDRGDFFKSYLRLSAVLLRLEGDASRAPLLWHNKQARHALESPIARPLLDCFTPPPSPPA